VRRRRQPWRERLSGTGAIANSMVLYWSFSLGTNWWLVVLDDPTCRASCRQTEGAAGTVVGPWACSHVGGDSAVAFNAGVPRLPDLGRAVDRSGVSGVFCLSTLHNAHVLFVDLPVRAMCVDAADPDRVAVSSAGGMHIASFNMMLQFNRRAARRYQAVAASRSPWPRGWPPWPPGGWPRVWPARRGRSPPARREHTFNHY